MSLNDRFTQLRRPEYETQGVLRGRVDMRGGTAKNKRLAMQMSRRPTVVAALAREAFEEIKTSAQRNGYGSGGGYGSFGGGFNPRGGVRRSYRGRGRGRGTVGGGLRRSGSFGNLSTISQSGNFKQTGDFANFRRARSRSREPRRGFGRSASVGRMQRSSSVTSLRSVSSFKGTGGRGRGRGRGGSRGRGGYNANGGGRMYRSASMTSLNNSFRGRGRGRGRGTRGANSVAAGFVNRRDQNRRGRGGFSRGRGGQNGQGRSRGGFRGRGGGRGAQGGTRGRGGRGGRWQRDPVPDKDLLDKELDQYMSGSRAHLDKELDNYMSEKWE